MSKSLPMCKNQLFVVVTKYFGLWTSHWLTDPYENVLKCVRLVDRQTHAGKIWKRHEDTTLKYAAEFINDPKWSLEDCRLSYYQRFWKVFLWIFNRSRSFLRRHLHLIWSYKWYYYQYVTPFFVTLGINNQINVLFTCTFSGI